MVNIFVLILSYSRFRIYRLSITKIQDILFNFLDDAFDTLDGVPHQLLCDNMPTIMDDARTKYKPGKVNHKFKQFADDYGFEVKPCIAGRPETKAKVESPMKILNELQGYNGELNYCQLQQKLKEINDRENARFHKSYQMVPIFGFDQEKSALHPLPKETLRRSYILKHICLKWNHHPWFHLNPCNVLYHQNILENI